MAKMTLEDNAISFFQESLSEAVKAEEDPSRWKYAILFIAQAMELALKERLRKEHHLLVFEKVEDTKRTVNLSQCLERLKKCNVFVPEDTKKLMDTAARWRNEIVHHEFDFEPENLKPIYAKLLVFLHTFFETSLGLKQDDYADHDQLKEIRDIAEYGDEFLQEAFRRVENKTSEEAVIDCPYCSNETFVVNVEKSTCICFYCRKETNGVACELCSWIPDLSDLKKLYTGNYKRHDSWQIICSDCASAYETDVEDLF